jgi:hypothetical protein
MQALAVLENEVRVARLQSDKLGPVLLEEA